MSLELMGSIAAIGFTVGVLTLPFKENVYWKLCEHLYLGLAAGYTLVLALNALNSNLFQQLTKGDAVFIIPLILSILLYSKYMKGVTWLNRYPIALMVGVGTAVSMRTVIDAQFIQQLRDSAGINIIGTGKGIVGDPATPINNLVILLGSIVVVLYFVFSEPRLMRGRSVQGLRQLGVAFIMVGFASEMGISIIMRVTRLGGRFFDLLLPESMLYTAIFGILAIISLALSKEK